MRGLTAGDNPADLRARDLQEDTEGGDSGVGVQHCVQSPNQQTCRRHKQADETWLWDDTH